MFGGNSFSGNYFGGLISSISGILPSTLSITVSINSVTVKVVSNISITPSVLTVNSSLKSPTIVTYMSVLVNPLALISQVILNQALVTGVLNYDTQTKINGRIRNIIPNSMIYNPPTTGIINKETVPRFRGS